MRSNCDIFIFILYLRCHTQSFIDCDENEICHKHNNNNNDNKIEQQNRTNS